MLSGRDRNHVVNDPNRCGICDGALRLRYRGRGRTLTPEDLAPSNHGVGAHTDVFGCNECGTLQQLGALRDGDLIDAYRTVHDDTYVREEEGRRRAARRLLDQVEAYAPLGRLLDVGCGHGFLLDEAQRRGYDVVGLEPSRSSAEFARESFGLDVREHAIDALGEAEAFDVIMVIDVLEHLVDPVGMIKRCRELLVPNGVLCVVTPDPSSRTARVAGKRWWGLLPAHTYVIPRATLCELVSGEGLVIATDTSFKRSFSAGYWLAGLAERAGVLGPVMRTIARAVGERVSISLTLGDERVVLAARAPVLEPARRLIQPGSAHADVHIVLPAYNAARTISTVAESLPRDVATRALLVDDASTDETTAVALRAGFEVIRHPTNRGYGANQKTCYVRAALDGAAIVVMVHADCQYAPEMAAEMITPIVEGRADVVIGSRLLDDQAIAGGMPRWKWVGNRMLTAIENRAFGRTHSEYHTGYRAFSIAFLRTIPFLRNSDGFVFDQEIFAQIVARDARVVELVIPTRYFGEASSVSFRDSVEYGLRTLLVLARFRVDRRRGSWCLLRSPAASLEVARDESQVGARSAVG